MHIRSHMVFRNDRVPSYGVVAGPSIPASDGTETHEVHGPFHTRAAAVEYSQWLRREYSDYRYTTICKIDTPAA